MKYETSYLWGRIPSHLEHTKVREIIVLNPTTRNILVLVPTEDGNMEAKEGWVFCLLDSVGVASEAYSDFIPHFNYVYNSGSIRLVALYKLPQDKRIFVPDKYIHNGDTYLTFRHANYTGLVIYESESDNIYLAC